MMEQKLRNRKALLKTKMKIVITRLNQREAYGKVRKHALRPPQVHRKMKGKGSYNRKSKQS
jgi:stalled ribosome alternative rescue factor ArfA